MDKRAKKIIDKCHKLIIQGYDIEYCLKKFNEYEAEIKDYFYIAEGLRVLREAGPSKEFSKSSLDSIIARAETLEAGVESRLSAPSISPRRLILKPAMLFIIFIVISVFSFSGTLFASQDSIPGETLYPLKRSFEEFRLNIYPEDFKGGLHLKFLNNRIEEAEILLDMENSIDPHLLEELISEMEDQYQYCRQYRSIEPGNEGTILDQIDSVKNRYRNRYGKDIDENDGAGQNSKEKNKQNDSSTGQGGKNQGGQGNGN